MNMSRAAYFSASRLPLALALLSALAACSPSKDERRGDRQERRESRNADDNTTQAKNSGGKAGDRVRQYDKDGDGIVTAAEFPTGKERRFKRMDTNGDGQLTGDELERRSRRAR